MLAVLGTDLGRMTTDLDRGAFAGRDLIGVTAAASIALAYEKRTGRNVIGRLKAGDPAASKRPAIIVGAHVDHLGTSGSGSRARPRRYSVRTASRHSSCC